MKYGFEFSAAVVSAFVLAMVGTSCAQDAGKGKTAGILAAPADTMGAKPIEGATVLLGADGDTSKFRSEKGKDKPVAWTVKDGVMTVSKGGGSIVTKDTVGDFRLHLEFNVPIEEDKKGGNPQSKGNSGVYIQRRYELQILNSHGLEPTKDNCGSIYKTKPPLKNASRPAGEWQTYDVVFRQARWEGDKKTQNARITVHHNGVLIHDDFSIPNKTGAGKKEAPEEDVLRLQDHSNPVSFRNVWIKRLKLD